MRKFTLTLLAALSGLFANAQVSSVDDLVGIYSVTGTGTESVTNYYAKTNISESNYNVEISKNEDGTVGIKNFFDLGYTLTGTVDLDAKTITIAPGQVEAYMTFGSATDASGSVVATYDDDATITIASFGAWYSTWNYVSDDASFTLTKEKITKDWSVTGHLVFYNDETGEKNNPYLTQEATLSKYTGADYDYILDFGVAGANPTSMQFTVADDGEMTITNVTAWNNTYYFYDVNESCKCFGLYTADGYSNLSGDEKGGEFYAWCYGYSDYSTLIGSGVAYFSWGTSDGISSVVAADKAQSGAIYDLTGRKVSDTSKAGIYIKNGKKFIVK